MPELCVNGCGRPRDGYKLCSDPDCKREWESKEKARRRKAGLAQSAAKRAFSGESDGSMMCALAGCANRAMASGFCSTTHRNAAAELDRRHRPLLTAAQIESAERREEELSELIFSMESLDTMVGRTLKGRIGTPMNGERGILPWARPLYATAGS